MKTAILGASGFIGKHVYDKFLQEGCEVISLGRSENNDAYMNLGEYASIIPALEKNVPDVLVHLASPSVQGIYRKNNQLNTDWAETVMGSEIIGSSILFKAAADLGIKKVIYLSSAAVYGKNTEDVPFKENMPLHPHTLYGAIKLAVEQIGQTLFPGLVSLRLFQTYGEGDIPTRLVPSILHAEEGNALQLTPCTQVSDLIYVKDVADCVYAVADENIPAGAYNLGYGEPVVLRDVVTTILRVEEKNIQPDFGAKKYSGTEVTYSCADMSLLYSKLKWRARYPLENGIKELVINKNQKNDKGNQS